MPTNKKEYTIEYRQKNKEKIKEIQRRYYLNSKARIDEPKKGSYAKSKSIVTCVNKLVGYIKEGEIDKDELKNIFELLEGAFNDKDIENNDINIDA